MDLSNVINYNVNSHPVNHNIQEKLKYHISNALRNTILSTLQVSACLYSASQCTFASEFLDPLLCVFIAGCCWNVQFVPFAGIGLWFMRFCYPAQSLSCCGCFPCATARRKKIHFGGKFRGDVWFG